MRDIRKSQRGPVLGVLAVVCVALGTFILVCGGPFAWVMRDGPGLGPETHTSYGREAWSNFFNLYFPMAFVGLFFTIYGVIICLLAWFAEKLSCYWITFVLLLIPLMAVSTVVVFLVRRLSVNWDEPSVESIEHAVDQYADVVDAIERYHAEQGRYPSSLTVLVPDYLTAVPGIYIEGGQVVEYLPMPSFGAPFTFYVYGHNTEQDLWRVWEEWELRYCQQDLCMYPTEYYPLNRINEDWIWTYRPESRPLFARPIIWIREPEPTPLPGWRYPTSEFFFVDVDVFPEGWAMKFPEYTATDPTTNFVSREWWQVGTSRSVRQSIWRAYTTIDAQEKYDELQGQFRPTRPLHPADFYVEFEPSEEINFQSQVADEFYLACGWWRGAHCRVTGRYRNYVVEMSLDLEAEREGHRTQGLTHAEIETIVVAMDTGFVEGMKRLYPTTEKDNQ
jgi:hypothetical protein